MWLLKSGEWKRRLNFEWQLEFFCGIHTWGFNQDGVQMFSVVHRFKRFLFKFKKSTKGTKLWLNNSKLDQRRFQ